MTTREIEKSREDLWNKNLEKLKCGVFGSKINEETLARYWKAQAEAGYPGASDNFMYFLQSIGGKMKQIDDMEIAVLQCYRNKYKAEGNDTEQGIIANAINAILPTLFAVKNGDYRKASEVAEEIFAEIEEMTKYFETPNGCAVVSLEGLAELEKKFTEDDNGNK